MEKKNYHRTIAVKASANEAMKKISQVNQWWAQNFSGKSERLNDKFTVRFGDTFVDFVVKELIPGEKVVWKVTDCNLHWIKSKKEWKGTEVVFDISPEKNSTRIGFTHVGLVPGVECYNDCGVGWDGYIKTSLVKYMNEDEGLPNQF